MSRIWELPSATVTEWRARISKVPGRQLVVSVSGGKDSTALCLLLKSVGIPYTAVHMDTGWESADTDRYIREVLPKHIGAITIVANCPEWEPSDPREVLARELEAMMGKDKSAFVRQIIRKRMFSYRVRRWCTEHLKIRPFQLWAQERHALNIVCAVGVRGEESKARAALPEWDMEGGFAGGTYLVWRPIRAWTEQDVIDWHHENNVPPNPMYTRGAMRVGCWPCVMARKAELRQMAEMDPGRVDVIRRLEAAVVDMERQRAEDEGKSFLHTDGTEKLYTFFANPLYKKEKREHLRQARGLGVVPKLQEVYAKVRTSTMAPVDKVIKWARSDRKGNFEPFAPLPHEDGCVRWGMCDLAWRDTPEPEDEE